MEKLIAAAAFVAVLTACGSDGSPKRRSDVPPRQLVPVVNSCENEKDTVEVAVETYRINHSGEMPATADDLLQSNGGNLSKLPKYWGVADGELYRIELERVPAEYCPRPQSRR